MGEIRVAIADDNERILELLGEIINSDRELNLVGKANNGEDMCSVIKEKEPDVVLLDLGLPDMDGVEVIKKIRSWSSLPIIVISARSEDSDKIEALDAGAII